ncbi:MAG TPA: creatininase family protein [Anaerolineaceae bacterium]|nr:creatininase family protein [Anaerolineaceae bacterium]HPN51876.1 creatininase family protein [Anaerolineaceae bacterium]
MRIDDLNWMDVEAYLKQEDRIMLVLGACEEHGYLSLMTDTRIPLALADAASQQTGVLVAPPLNFGVSPYFLTYPGTISLRASTYLAVVEDMVRSLYGQGFRRFMCLNGHGGNEGVRSRLVELSNELPGLQVSWYAWWLSNTVSSLAAKYQLKPSHASWMEAFSFTRVCELPPGGKTAPSYTGLLNAERTRQVYGDGVFDGPYQADEAVMTEMFEAILQDVLYLLKFNT